MSTEQQQLQQILDAYTVRDSARATRLLDALLSQYAQHGQIHRITATLEMLVGRYPTDKALRARLAALYQRLGYIESAVEQLDSLGELQLETGDYTGAVRTIRQLSTLR